jgi:two-component system nitrate/nitrite response regulator NarL
LVASSCPKVAVAGAIRMSREALAFALERQAGFAVHGVFDVDDSAVRELHGSGVLIVVDTSAEKGLEMLPAFATDTDCRVVAVGVPATPPAFVACAEAGVDGLVTQDADLGEIANAIRVATTDGVSCTSSAAAGMLRCIATLRQQPTNGVLTLTRREREIADYVAAGCSNKDIANVLSVALPTVKTHVRNILRKLSVSRRTQVAAALDAHQ